MSSYYDCLRENSDHGWDTQDLVLEFLACSLPKISKEAKIADDFEGILVVGEMLSQIGFQIINCELESWQENNPALAKNFFSFRLELEKALWQFIHCVNSYNIDLDPCDFINVDFEENQVVFAAVFDFAKNWFLDSSKLKNSLKKPPTKIETTLWRKYLPIQKVLDPNSKSIWLKPMAHFDQNTANSLGNILHFWLLDQAVLSEAEYITVVCNFVQLKNNIQN